MRIAVAIVLGLFSGFLVYFLAAIAFVGDSPSSVFVFVTFFGGWAISSYLIVRKTRTVSKVFARGFLIGAAEWLALIPAGVLMSGRALTETVAEPGAAEESAASLVGATAGAGCFSFITGGVAVVMTLVCLIGFAVAHFTGREMQPENPAPTKRCPDCAELIQAAARKCKHCGASLTEVDVQT